MLSLRMTIRDILKAFIHHIMSYGMKQVNIQYTSRDTGEHVFTVHQGGMTEEQMRLILAEMGVGE